MSDASPSSQPSPPADPPNLLSCYICKSRKLKCDRRRPTCGRCVKSGDVCEYPSARKRPVAPVARPRIHELESRVRDLEGKLRTRENSIRHRSPNLDLVETGRYEQLPPPSVVEELTSLYFSKIHWDSPMLHPARYMASMLLPPHMHPPMCLQYAILAAAASASPTYNNMAEAFYRRGRKYLEADEMRDDSGHVSLGHTQAWVIFSFFEAQHLWFGRASVSVARAVRLSQVLGLHKLDAKNQSGLTLPPPRDWSEQEERRRTFWVLFTTDRLTSSTGGWPTLMDSRHIYTKLPSSADAFHSGIEEPTLHLKEALRHGLSGLSASACRIVAAHIFNECIEFSMGELDDEDDVWSKLEQLDRSVITAYQSLPPHLRCPDYVHDNDAIFTNMLLHTATICIHRAACARVQTTMAALPNVSERVRPAAQEIVTIVALVPDINTRFRNPLIAHATYMSASYFAEDFIATQNPQSEEKLTALMDLMVAVGKENIFTGSLAIQLAQNLKHSGVDPRALEKVEVLMAEIKLDVPLLGQVHEDTGSVLLCPLAGQPGHPPAEGPSPSSSMDTSGA